MSGCDTRDEGEGRGWASRRARVCGGEGGRRLEWTAGVMPVLEMPRVPQVPRDLSQPGGGDDSSLLQPTGRVLSYESVEEAAEDAKSVPAPSALGRAHGRGGVRAETVGGDGARRSGAFPSVSNGGPANSDGEGAGVEPETEPAESEQSSFIEWHSAIETSREEDDPGSFGEACASEVKEAAIGSSSADVRGRTPGFASQVKPKSPKSSPSCLSISPGFGPLP